jgi:hypothetical protein
MTQEDKVALKEFLSGAAVVLVVPLYLLVIIFASGISGGKPIKNSNI